MRCNRSVRHHHRSQKIHTQLATVEDVDEFIPGIEEYPEENLFERDMNEKEERSAGMHETALEQNLLVPRRKADDIENLDDLETEELGEGYNSLTTPRQRLPQQKYVKVDNFLDEMSSDEDDSDDLSFEDISNLLEDSADSLTFLDAKQLTKGMKDSIEKEETDDLSPNRGFMQEFPSHPPGETNSDPPAETNSDPPGEANSDPPAEANSDPPGAADSDPPGEADSDPPVEANSVPPGEANSDPPGEANSDPPEELESVSIWKIVSHLPGEFDPTEDIEEAKVEVSETRLSVRNLEGDPAIQVEESQSDEVQAFTLDPDFDYDNVRLTPKWSHENPSFSQMPS
ncbi:hypothetical protein BSL78_25904 [Apostichopus japonicus]|uniref:Uncharacterized protein n=1 Tax=Stichopus japonicus TaxID=307972 RepID=A0A2G8JNH1_STIJA|nr:hypothetical protein BSL78_25904 [Apostichopus japonicus]